MDKIVSKPNWKLWQKNPIPIYSNQMKFVSLLFFCKNLKIYFDPFSIFLPFSTPRQWVFLAKENPLKKSNRRSFFERTYYYFFSNKLKHRRGWETKIRDDCVRRCQFHQHFTRSFYLRMQIPKAQKYSQVVSLCSTFAICASKSCE